MREIQGEARTVRELLKGIKYSIDYYQREYKWGEKQATELVNDLVGKFLEDYDEKHERKKVADYLLANIDDGARVEVNNRWKVRVRELVERDKEGDADFFKAWLRSQYATKIRERKKGAKQEDFDRIGTEYHRWLRDSRRHVGLDRSSDFLRIINVDFEFYSKQYLRLLDASAKLTPGLEHVCYNSWNGFTQQFQLLLSPLRPSDSSDEIARKIRITSKFIDILLTWRLWNFRSIAYSTMQYAMFLVMRDIRGLDAASLAELLHEKLQAEEENFDNNSEYHRQGVGLYLHQQNRKVLHRILARLPSLRYAANTRHR